MKTAPAAPRVIRPVAPDAAKTTEIGRFQTWLREHRGLDLPNYPALHRWSVTDLPGFWSAVWDFSGVRARSPWRCVLEDSAMPGATWFPSAELNYAEHAVLTTGNGIAITAYSQTRDRLDLSWDDLRGQVARARAGLQRLGVGRGDRVVAYLPNVPEAVIAFLATASLGAIWASCAPEFGARSVVERFAQIEPTVLLAVTGYRFGSKDVDRSAEVEQITAGLPSLRHVVHVPFGPWTSGQDGWARLLSEPAPLAFEPVPFDHPLCVLFSSGTTGKPKAIVHGHGGILLEHLKSHALSWDLHAGDCMLWFSTTAWMMWNSLVSGLLVGARIVLVDGNPVYPDLDWQWRLAEETGATLMGASPGFLMACRTAGLSPAADHDLSRLRQIGAAGSPLPEEGFRWVLEQFGPGVLLNVGSGGTDVCTGIVQGSPLQPVYAGEISGPCLGVDARAFDEHGEEVPAGTLGELVITAPMPSMPLGFWGDDGTRLRATYFDTYPGVWRHGDWIRFSETGSCLVAGRSDATLNRGGVRLGTAEFYQVVEEFAEVEDSLVVHLEDPAGGNGDLLLFVQLTPGSVLDEHLTGTISAALRAALSPRHTPDRITAVPLVPRNRTGKKLELPAKRVLLGAPVEDVASRETLADPTALDFFADHARSRR